MGVPSAMFEFIQEMEKDPSCDFTVAEMCAMAGVSRSGYYGWKNASARREEREEADRRDFELILLVYNRHGYSKGVESIHMGLLHLNPSVLMNVKKIRRIMRKFGLVCPIRKPNPYRKMAKALEESSVAPNILRREFESYGPRAVLLTDITYLHYGAGLTCYLSTIEDAYTKEILAWVVSQSLEVGFVLETINQLIAEHGDELSDAVLVHSDQGSHYTSHAFRNILHDKGFIQSMSRKGNCWDNQRMEYFFSNLKDHIRPRIANCSTFEEVLGNVKHFITYYNNERYQWKLAKLSPAEYYKFCMTGVYPLLVENQPAQPVAAKTAEDLRQRAQEAQEEHRKKGAGTEASDSTLDKAADQTPKSGQRLPQ